MSFTLPTIHDNPDGSWGPSPSQIPAHFREIPYAPYSKSDKLGRVADWNDTDAGARAAGAATLGAATLQSGAGTGPRTEGGDGGGGGRGRGGGKFGPGRGGRDGQQAFGSGTSSAFAYFHVEDEASFSLVDNKGSVPRRGGPLGFSRGRGGANQRGGMNARGQFRGGQRGGQPGRNFNNNGGMRGGRRGFKDWDKSTRMRESSVPISPNWKLLEEIEFSRLAKLRLDVDEPDLLSSHGKLYPYDKAYDRVTTKAEKPLQIIDRLRYNPTTSDDPVIQKLAGANTAQIYATDTILAVLMTAPRSVYSWDIVIVRDGDKLFLDKRDGGPLDFLSVNENSTDPPMDSEKESINSAISLALEATYVNQNFALQVVRESDQSLMLDEPNPFHESDDSIDQPALASCGYRYRLFDLSVNEEEDIKIAVRTEVDTFVPGTGKDEQFVNVRALNEFDSRVQGAGGAPDWRSKLDSQRGAVVTTEMKNNSCKLARWAVASVLAGADALKVGYISRANARDNSRHVVLSTSTLRPSDFAGQLNVSLANGWGIVRAIADTCLKLQDGKYVLVKDPNRPVLRLFAVPANAFTGEEEEEILLEEEEGEIA